ncbi:MAG: HypC/HybG/HupF family hydrogenase formation chaperone [Candidatus Omnitrophota bacterium]
MCLGIPMKVVSRTGDKGIAELGKMKRQIGLHLLSDVGIGDYVIVHAGFAIQKLDEKLAEEILENMRRF